MRFVDDTERELLAAAAALTDGNPFLPGRVEAERSLLGRRFSRATAVWHAEADLHRLHPNIPKLTAFVEEFAPRLRERLAAGASARPDELLHYEALARYLLFYRYEREFVGLIALAAARKPATGPVDAYEKYARDFTHFLGIPGIELPVHMDPAHCFAWGFQIRRAFHFTFRQIYGGSMPAARLRAAVWQSIFTHDAQRYRRALYDRMGDHPTLIVGESGTGKELVARAIGHSRYIPFDPRTRCFTQDFGTGFHAVNLSALSPTLIESELFGHRRGAFTGAVVDRTGWLESCGPGTVFLDEIGELDAAVQVKLLRVLQTRTFQRIGETRDREFRGKIVAATNRDLVAEMHAERFRPDFFYRLNSDLIHAPTLREQLADAPDDLRNLVGILARRIAGEEEACALAEEVERWVETELGRDYPWPGNVRELEQCVRNVLIRGRYTPAALPTRPVDDLVAHLEAGELTADALLRHYCTLVYARVGSYEEAARRLGLDRRTVKARVDPDLLERLRG